MEGTFRLINVCKFPCTQDPECAAVKGLGKKVYFRSAWSIIAKGLTLPTALLYVVFLCLPYFFRLPFSAKKGAGSAHVKAALNEIYVETPPLTPPNTTRDSFAEGTTNPSTETGEHPSLPTRDRTHSVLSPEELIDML